MGEDVVHWLFLIGKQYTLVKYTTLSSLLSLSFSLSLSLSLVCLRWGTNDRFLVELHENVLSILSGVYASGSFHVTYKIIANNLVLK